jgi:hypothetical protein
MTIAPDELSDYMHSRDAGNPGDMAYTPSEPAADIALATRTLTRYQESAKSKVSWIIAMFQLMRSGVWPTTAYRWLKTA